MQLESQKRTSNLVDLETHFRMNGVLDLQMPRSLKIERFDLQKQKIWALHPKKPSPQASSSSFFFQERMRGFEANKHVYSRPSHYVDSANSSESHGMIFLSFGLLKSNLDQEVLNLIQS